VSNSGVAFLHEEFGGDDNRQDCSVLLGPARRRARLTEVPVKAGHELQTFARN